MDYFAGLDVSVKDTSVGIVDDAGKIVREVKVASEPEALLAALKNPAYRFKRIGLEAGPLSQWLFSALAEAELPVICVETRHMRAALKAQINKSTATMPVAPRRSPRLRWRAGAERNLSKSVRFGSSFPLLGFYSSRDRIRLFRVRTGLLRVRCKIQHQAILKIAQRLEPWPGGRDI